MTSLVRTVPSSSSSLTKAHKAAVILAALSSETASAIIQEISDAHLKAFARAFSDLKAVPAPLLHVIAQEFLSEVERSSAELVGGMEETKKMLASLAEGDRVNRILSELHGGGSSSVWKRLSVTKPEQLLPFLQTQRQPIAAAIISKLDFEQAAGIFSIADPQYAHTLLTELARGKPPSDEALENLALAIEEDFLKPQAAAPSKEGVNEIVSEIINFLPSPKRNAFLHHLDTEDKEIAQAVRRAILTFQDLHLRLNETGASALLRDIEKDALIKALQYGQTNAPETVAFLMANVSKRMADQYSEEISAADPLSEEDGERAQRLIMRKLRDLAHSGEVKLSPPPT